MRRTGKLRLAFFISGLTSSLRVTGAGAEAFRAIWHRYDDSKPTAPQLALTGHLIEHPFVLKELAAWMESIPDTPGMQLVDFFTWNNGSEGGFRRGKLNGTLLRMPLHLLIVAPSWNN